MDSTLMEEMPSPNSSFFAERQLQLLKSLFQQIDKDLKEIEVGLHVASDETLSSHSELISIYDSLRLFEGGLSQVVDLLKTLPRHRLPEVQAKEVAEYRQLHSAVKKIFRDSVVSSFLEICDRFHANREYLRQVERETTKNSRSDFGSHSSADVSDQLAAAELIANDLAQIELQIRRTCDRFFPGMFSATEKELRATSLRSIDMFGSFRRTNAVFDPPKRINKCGPVIAIGLLILLLLAGAIWLSLNNEDE